MALTRGGVMLKQSAAGLAPISKFLFQASKSESLVGTLSRTGKPGVGEG